MDWQIKLSEMGRLNGHIRRQCVSRHANGVAAGGIAQRLTGLSVIKPGQLCFVDTMPRVKEYASPNTPLQIPLLLNPPAYALVSMTRHSGKPGGAPGRFRH